MDKSTPRPWQMSGVRVRLMLGNAPAEAHAVGPDSDAVVLVMYQSRTAELHAETYANAQLVVRAVNSHDALVEALREMLAAHSAAPQDMDREDAAVQAARAALALAKET